MKLDSETRSVAFITVAGDDQCYRPIGTGFIVRKGEEDSATWPMVCGEEWHTYLVTAAHVVRSRRESTYVRLPPKEADTHTHEEPTCEDLPVRGWVFHDDPGVDVAVAPLELPATGYAYRSLMAPPSNSDGRSAIQTLRGRARLGETVYFIGLLGEVPEMGKRNIPMIRSGTLGAWWQENVPVQVDGNTVLATTAHLIDAHSHAGFSGSPCFVYVPHFDGERPKDDEPLTPEAFGRCDEKILIGLVRGHFPHIRRVNIEQAGAQLGSAQVPINTGVAVVTPAPYIGDVLAKEELIQHRGAKRQQRLNDKE